MRISLFNHLLIFLITLIYWLSYESLMITLQNRLLYLAHSSFLFIVYCHLPNKTGCLSHETPDLHGVKTCVRGIRTLFLLIRASSWNIISVTLKCRTWAGDVSEEVMLKCGHFSHWKHFFYYYSNDIKLTLTNTSHIVPSNYNVETYLAIDVGFFFSDISVEFEQDQVCHIRSHYWFC